MTGKAPRSKAKQPSEIIPPDKTDDTTDTDAASSGATSKAGAHLRMPTFIDAEGNWRAMVSGFFGDRLAHGLGAGRRFVGGLVYRTTLLLLLVTALGAILTWGSWWCVPFFFAYGVLYGSASDARWHEHGHGTAFKTPWMNDTIYVIASFMILRTRVPVWGRLG